ncbi:MAG: DAK2 domain-containing protein [Bacilli bacterium]
MSVFNEKILDGEGLRSILISGANNLFNHYPEVDALNVFPVPDGDTGTNMNLAITSGAKEIMNIRNVAIGDIGKAFSRGLLMGARGNSGVILSQIFRGFAQSIEGKETIDIQGFADAWTSGCKIAYKAVMRPVEGTILTVIRESSAHLASEVPNLKTIGEAMECLLTEAEASLARTPDLLPVLKEVGVVDSGGAGLVRVMEGMLLGLKGEIIERKQISLPHAEQEERVEALNVQSKFKNDEFGYCTEFILRLANQGLTGKKKSFDESVFKGFLESIGNSIVIVRDEELVKVHVHTLKPGAVFNYAQLYGEFVTLKVENMQEQHTHLTNGSIVTGGEKEVATAAPKETAKPTKTHKKYAIITVSVGSGLDEMFKSLNADYIVSGGQSMNPATEDFVKALDNVDADHIFILPNNKNILMAAEQAAQVSEGKDVQIIPTKTINEGLSACMMLNPDVDVETNLEEMKDAVSRVVSGQVTFSIKDTVIDDIRIKKNYFMGILGTKKIVASEKRLSDACFKLLDKMISPDSSIVTIIYGEDVSKDEAEKLATKISKEYKIETDLHEGDQPVYFYYFGVE